MVNLKSPTYRQLKDKIGHLFAVAKNDLLVVSMPSNTISVKLHFYFCIMFTIDCQFKTIKGKPKIAKRV